MGKLITLDAYYNRVGRSIYPDWSDETVNYHSEQKKKFLGFRERANAVLAKAINQIWDDGAVKVTLRREQGYLDPWFAIDGFDFFRSYCSDKDGNEYHCLLELSEKQKQGAPVRHEWIYPYIKGYAEEYYSLEQRNSGTIPADAIISYIKQISKEEARGEVSESSIRRYIKKLYPKTE